MHDGACLPYPLVLLNLEFGGDMCKSHMLDSNNKIVFGGYACIQNGPGNGLGEGKVKLAIHFTIDFTLAAERDSGNDTRREKVA